MRPDEHKKKKNTQYKKKHGISSASENKDKVTIPGNVKQKSKSANETKNDGLTSKHLSQTVKGQADRGSSDEETRKRFSRRHVVSNWSRYDEMSSDDSDDEKPTKRGEDFNKLLAQAGGSAAQFRFKDEEDWNVDGVGETTPDFLALNLADISQSLNCLPLHQRLGLNASLFNNDQIQDMTSTAKQNNQHYEQSVQHRPKPKSIIKKSSPKNHPKMYKTRTSPKRDEEKTKNIRENKVNSHSDNICAQKTTQANCNTAKMNGDLMKENIPYSLMNEQNSSSADKPSPRKTKDVLELEDDLDALLELEDPMATMTKVPFLEYHRQHTDCIDGQADRSDNKIITAPPSSVGPQPIPTVQSGPAKTGSDNLENWLDSMLED